jgi:hypothetical protein
MRFVATVVALLPDALDPLDESPPLLPPHAARRIAAASAAGANSRFMS